MGWNDDRMPEEFNDVISRCVWSVIIGFATVLIYAFLTR